MPKQYRSLPVPTSKQLYSKIRSLKRLQRKATERLNLLLDSMPTPPSPIVSVVCELIKNQRKYIQSIEDNICLSLEFRNAITTKLNFENLHKQYNTKINHNQMIYTKINHFEKLLSKICIYKDSHNLFKCVLCNQTK